MEKLANWLCDTQDKILFVENISGFDFLTLVAVVIFVIAVCCSNRLRKKFF